MTSLAHQRMRARTAAAERTLGSLWFVDFAYGGLRTDGLMERVFYGPEAERLAYHDRRRRL